MFYWRKGALGGHVPDTGRRIERFTPFERAAHWANAIAFVALAVSGIVMAFGKFFLLPVLGGTLFGWLSYALKNLHNFAGPLFAVSLLIVFVTFVKDNLPRPATCTGWRAVGGLLGGARSAFAPLQRRREAGVLGRRAAARRWWSSARAWCSTS